MLSSILGDIIGSRFEFMATQEKNVTLFHPGCSWTDDTVLTYAVSKSCFQIKNYNIYNNEDIEQIFVDEFKKVVKTFPMAGWGKNFHLWAKNTSYFPNASAGNGCLMRISPVVMFFKDLETVQKIGKLCTKTSHNHFDSYKSVEVFLDVLYYLLHSIPNHDLLNQNNIETRKQNVKKIIEKHGIVLDSVENFHKIGGYWGLAKDTLIRAFAGYLEGNSYENVMQKILYIGSDTDTTANIAGCLAELTLSLNEKTIHHIYRYFDHTNFYMIKQVCGQYIQDDNKYIFENLFDDFTQLKIKELILHQPIDQTAQWDPLELPSDEDYYKSRIEITPIPSKSVLELFHAFSFKKFIKKFLKNNT